MLFCEDQQSQARWNARCAAQLAVLRREVELGSEREGGRAHARCHLTSVLKCCFAKINRVTLAGTRDVQRSCPFYVGRWNSGPNARGGERMHAAIGQVFENAV